LRRVSASIRATLRAKPWRAEEALIVYVDQTTPSEQPLLTPCRFATIVEVAEHGTTASLVLELNDFAYASDLAAFNKHARQVALHEEPPTRNNLQKITGHYWAQVTSTSLVERSRSLETWERLLAQLVTSQDFTSQPVFYHVPGMFDVRGGGEATIEGGRINLAAGREYELRLYHFHPAAANADASLSLRLELGDSAGHFVSNPKLAIDSRYDLKRIRIRTAEATKTFHSYLSIIRQYGGGEGVQTELPICILGRFWPTLMYGLALGGLLAVPQIVATFNNPNLPATNQYLVASVAVVIGCITGIFAAFGLRKAP
jgi:hypothetical protein